MGGGGGGDLAVSVFVGMESCIGRKFKLRSMLVFVVDVKWFSLCVYMGNLSIRFFLKVIASFLSREVCVYWMHVIY